MQLGTGPGLEGRGSPTEAWWEMAPQLGTQPITTMSVYPGDVMSASVQYITSGAFAGYFLLWITDDSRPNDSFFTLQLAPTSGSDGQQRNSAEWIVEGDGTNSPVSFADATATINGVTGPIDSPLWQSEALNLGAYGLTTESTTSMLTNQGDAFVVNPIATANVIGPNIMTAVPPSRTSNGPDITAAAIKEKPQPHAAAIKVQDTAADPAWRARRLAIAIDRPVADVVESARDIAAGRTKAFRPTRIGSHRAH